MRHLMLSGLLIALSGCAMLDEWDHDYEVMPAAAWYDPSVCGCSVGPAQPFAPQPLPPAPSYSSPVIPASVNVPQSGEPELLRR